MAVKSAERVFRIFELLEQSPEGLTNKEVSSLLGFAPSSTLALLQTMEENGYLSADEQKRYYLGGRLMSLGAVAASRIDLNKIGTPYLKKLMQTVKPVSLEFFPVMRLFILRKKTVNVPLPQMRVLDPENLYTVQDLEKHFLRFFRKKKALRLLTALN